MKRTNKLVRLIGCCILAPFTVLAATRYVWQDSPNPGSGFSDWSTAAHTIQEAVDAAQADDTVLVTNGLYATGGRAASGAVITNRVAVDKAITLTSVNGPQTTVIQGYQVPGTINGNGGIRCVYLTNGAVLDGFSLTNGATRTAGNSTWEQSGGGVCCASADALVTNCLITSSSAARFGGGAYSGTLKHCTLTANSASSGGGAASSTLDDCTITANSAGSGGGVAAGTLNNCTLTANSASSGGGTSSGTLNNCSLTGNSAVTTGGGAYSGTLNNCTLTGNSAVTSGGGASSATLRNCILYYQHGRQRLQLFRRHSQLLLHHPASRRVGPATSPPSRNWPAPPTSAPGPPAAGPAAPLTRPGLTLTGTLGSTRPPSVAMNTGQAPSPGSLTVSIGASWTNVAAGYPLDLTAWISGRVTASVWDFGDGTVLSNRPYASHAWGAPGEYSVVLTAYNETHPEGVSATIVVRALANTMHYVSAGSANPVPPYYAWDTAAQTIQDAVDAAASRRHWSW